MNRILLINAVPADHSPLAAQVTTVYLARVAAAVQIQLRDHVAPHWPEAAGSEVRVYDPELDAPDPEGAAVVECWIVPAFTAPGTAGDIAYHDDDAQGDPQEDVALDEEESLDSLSQSISHECEFDADPKCDQWVPVPGTDKSVALERCDPPQNRTYGIDLGDGLPPVTVSDFCLPAWFGRGTGATTYLESIGKAPRLEPFSLAPGSGYMLQRGADGKSVEVFGEARRGTRAKLAAGVHRRQR